MVILYGILNFKDTTKMKKLLLSALLAIGFSTFATFQYNQVGSQGYFTFDAPTALNMTTSIFNNPFSLHHIAPISDFGYYKLGSDKLTGNRFISADQNNFLGNFTSADKIGIWIQDANHNIYTSTRLHNGFSTFGSAGSDATNFTLYKPFSIETYSSHYEYKIMEKNAPSGQPLPGVLTSLLVAGGVAWGLKKRREKNSAQS